jgi:hypothetical protein
MGQFSVEKPVAPGSVLSGNQQNDAAEALDGRLCEEACWVPVQRQRQNSGDENRLILFI